MDDEIKKNNQNNSLEETDDNININNLEIINDEITNLTDSDIEDEKYQPTILYIEIIVLIILISTII